MTGKRPDFRLSHLDSFSRCYLVKLSLLQRKAEVVNQSDTYSEDLCERFITFGISSMFGLW